MFDSGNVKGFHAASPTRGQARGGDGASVIDRGMVGWERSPEYDPHGGLDQEPAEGWGTAPSWGAVPASPVAEAVAALEAAIDQLAALELGSDDDRGVLDASVALHRLRDRLAAQGLRVLREVERRGAYGLDGAVTTASWFRDHTRIDHPEASGLVVTARRLEDFPLLGAAVASGEITMSHAHAVTRAVRPWRLAGLQQIEETLVELARTATPRDVRGGVARACELIDRDGVDDPPEDFVAGPDPRRELYASWGIDALLNGRFTLDTLTGELFQTLLDAYDHPDPEDTPQEAIRTPAQRRHDAFDAMLRDLAASGKAPTVAGYPAHMLGMIDIATLLGADDCTMFTPRLRYAGPIPPAVARRLALEAKFTLIQTGGDWRPVSVGRTMRNLPPWLKTVVHMLHGFCRGLGCDRPVAWTEAHHDRPWEHGGETSITNTTPNCKAHHNLATHHGWETRTDPDTGTCTWIAPDGRTFTTYPRGRSPADRRIHQLIDQLHQSLIRPPRPCPHCGQLSNVKLSAHIGE